jgi:hypothetical protein
MRDLGGAISGGAKTLACRKGSATTDAAGTGAAIKTAGAVIAGETARHPIRQAAGFVQSQQQSSAGVVMPMLSHGTSADCAQALAAGPKASQKARTATMRK